METWYHPELFRELEPTRPCDQTGLHGQESLARDEAFHRAFHALQQDGPRVVLNF